MSQIKERRLYPRPGNADLCEVAAQWRRLAEDAEAKERYN
jgi:hypothetical protein